MKFIYRSILAAVLWMFLLLCTSNLATAQQITRGEYFTDTDPGFGAGTSFNLTPGTTVPNLSFEIPVNGMTDGFHRLYFRLKNDQGVWGHTISKTIFKQQVPDYSIAPIVRGEHFIDVDPGIGKAAPMPIVATGAGAVATTLEIPWSALLREGFHKLYTRYVDSRGVWSHAQSRIFYHVVPNNIGANILGMEYFIDEDPGFGKGIALFPNQVPNTEFQFFPDLTNVPIGIHKLYIRAKNQKGDWSITQYREFRIEPPGGHFIELGPLPPFICGQANLPVTFTLHSAFDANNVFTLQLSDNQGNFTNPRNIGTLAGNKAGTIPGKIDALSIGGNYRLRIVSSLPKDTSEVSIGLAGYSKPNVFNVIGDTIVCQGNAKYSLWNTWGGVEQYQWSLPEGGGAITRDGLVFNINWNELGTHKLKVVDKNFCANEDSVRLIDIEVTDQGPTGPFGAMIPANGVTDLQLPITFSWPAVNRAVTYDIYIWPEEETRPAQPMIPNLTAINHIFRNENSQLKFEKTYRWQIIARRGCFSLESPVHIFRLPYLPNLQTTKITVPPGAFSEEDATVSWEVKNAGQGPTVNQAWSDLVYLSEDQTLDVHSDYLVGTVASPTGVNAGQSYSQNHTFKVPVGLDGPFFVFVVPNAFRQQNESNYNDNTGISLTPIAITLTPPPDLKVSMLVGPNTAFSGETYDIRMVISNVGAGHTTTGRWVDEIYLSPEPRADHPNAVLVLRTAAGEYLQAGKDFTRVYNVKLPNGISGKFYFVGKTDVNDQVYEHANESNNEQAGNQVDLILTPPVDMQPVLFIVEPEINVYNQLKLRWRVENKGHTPTKNGQYWSDGIYLSKTPEFDIKTAYFLGGASNQGIIKPGEGYTIDREIMIPANLQGPYYVFLYTDYQNFLYEHTDEDNNIMPAPNPLIIKAPDIEPVEITGPARDSSGTKMTIRYKFKNVGDGILYDHAVTDKIYISNFDNYPPLHTMTEVGTLRYRTGELAAGASIEKTISVTLPNNINNQYYIYVYSDFLNEITEPASENNNLRRSAVPVNIVLDPWPDLQVSNIIAPPAAKAGTLMPINFRMINKGAKLKEGYSWMDQVFISNMEVWTPSLAINIGDFYRSTTLEPNEEYEVNGGVKIPSTMPGGTYYIYVVADQGNNVYEHTDEFNNIKRSDPITLSAYPPVDFSNRSSVVVELQPKSPEFRVQWNGYNPGNNAPVLEQWTDGIYLSPDDKLDITKDILVAEVPQSGTLQPKTGYTVATTVRLPKSLRDGIYYIFTVVDHHNVQVDINRDNNYQITLDANGEPARLFVDRGIPADLVVTNITAPLTVTAGQPPHIKWYVKNQGAGKTDYNNWVDRVYLSQDNVLDAWDIQLGITGRNEYLQAGATYEDSLTEKIIPLTAKGNYYLIVKTDATERVYEHLSEDNNTFSIPINVIEAEKCDLSVPKVTVRPALLPPPNGKYSPGERIKIIHTHRNNSSSPAYGIYSVGYYLSRDRVKDPTDILLGAARNVSVNIQANTERDHGDEFSLPGVPDGKYFILVHSDLQNNLPETNEDNNLGVTDEPIDINVHELPINTTQQRQTYNYTESYWKVYVDDAHTGEALLVKVSKQIGVSHNELYVKYGDVPTRSDYDFIHTKPWSNAQELTIPALRRGLYYIMTRGIGTANELSPMDIGTEIRRFEIRNIETNVGGNTGNVTVKISGNKFEEGMTFQLTNGTRVINGRDLKFIDPTTVYVTFNLQGTDPDKYTVVATNKANVQTRLVDGFRVSKGLVGVAVISVKHPPNTRWGQVVGMQIEFMNEGNLDLPLTTRDVLSVMKAPIGLTTAELEAGRTGIQFELLDPLEPLQILRPGGRATITVYTKAVNMLKFQLRK